MRIMLQVRHTYCTVPLLRSLRVAARRLSCMRAEIEVPVAVLWVVQSRPMNVNCVVARDAQRAIPWQKTALA